MELLEKMSIIGVMQIKEEKLTHLLMFLGISILVFILLLSAKNRAVPVVVILCSFSILFFTENKFEMIKIIEVNVTAFMIFIYRYFPKANVLKYLVVLGIFMNITHVALYEIILFSPLYKINGVLGCMLGLYILKFMKQKSLIDIESDFSLNIDHTKTYLAAYSLWNLVFVIHYFESIAFPYLIYALLYPLIYVLFIKHNSKEFFSSRALALSFTIYLVISSRVFHLDTIRSSLFISKDYPYWNDIIFLYKDYILGFIILINSVLTLKCSLEQSTRVFRKGKN